MRERATATLVLRMFRAGLNTHQIAERLEVLEPKVVRLLIKAREDDRDFDNSTIPAKHEPVMESREER